MRTCTFLALLLSLFMTQGTNAQVRMCRVCKKSITACPYKGNHPKAAQPAKSSRPEARNKPAARSTPTATETKTFTVNGVSFKMVKVQGGTYRMGATPEQENPSEIEKPVHNVTLSSFYIGQTEVTQALWKAVMGSVNSHFEGADLPVELVKWDECQEFITKLNNLTGKHFRMPTEAEWEFAARGGNKSRHYQYSGSNNLNEVAWVKENSNQTTHPVGTKRPNELGIYDMSGNVCEWVSNCVYSYTSESQTNPQGPSTEHPNFGGHLRRGGGYVSAPIRCRVSYRKNETSHGRDIGLRLAMDD